MVALSSDGAATVTVPAGTVLYSDTARTKPVTGTVTAKVCTLRGIPSTLNNSFAGFKNMSTIIPSAQNGWLNGDVTKAVKSVVAVADITMTNGTDQVSTTGSPITVNLKLPSSYAPNGSVDYYSFDVTLNSWTKEGTATVKADNSIDMSVTHLSHWGVVTFTDYVPPGTPGNGFVPAGTYTVELSINGVPSFNKVTFLVNRSATNAPPFTITGYKDATGTVTTAFNGGAISGSVTGSTSPYAFDATIAAGTVGATAVGPISFTGTVDATTGVLSGTYSYTDASSNTVTNPFAAVNGFTAYLTSAKAYAGDDMVLNANMRCQLESSGGRGIPLGIADNVVQEPTWIFDNLAVIGTGWVKMLLLKTSAGLVAIDTMNNPGDVTNIIVPGLAKLGLDPKDIHGIVITHGHADHYGGATALKAVAAADAKVYLSAVDEVFMNQSQNVPGGPGFGVPQPVADVHLTDGQKLIFGDTTVTAVLTPGHTPGCTSFIIPVKDNGVPHMAALLGGNAYPGGALVDTGSLVGSTVYKYAGRTISTYLTSLDHYSAFTSAANVDVALNAHPFVDNTFGRMKLLKNRKSGDPNPWVLGRANYMRYEGVTREVGKAYFARTNPLQ